MDLQDTFFSKIRTEGIAHIVLQNNYTIPSISDEELQIWHNTAAMACPLMPPEVSVNAAHWASRVLYILCTFIVDRRFVIEEIDSLIQIVPEPNISDENSWTVDLFFRQLPRLHTIAQKTSSNDPLLKVIEDLIVKWPLCSPGMSEIQPLKLNTNHTALVELFIERIIEAEDVSKVYTQHIRDRIISNIGIDKRIAPSFRNSIQDLIL